MEDFLITLQVSFVDTETGEVIFTSQFSKPLSIFGSDVTNYCKYFDSFFRGVRQRKKVALTLTIVNDREITKSVEQYICF